MRQGEGIVIKSVKEWEVSGALRGFERSNEAISGSPEMGLIAGAMESNGAGRMVEMEKKKRNNISVSALIS